ncbi:MAG: sugar phosphate isomerase/epimerase [Oscillospiraceae bacterium]|nr:sugar phosphate isomerase/epimerase [Oscillospiraceae bacterium]
MRKGLNVWTVPGGHTVRECVHKAKEAGFDGIELAMAEKGELSLESDDGEAAGLREYARSIGIGISGLATGLYWKYGVASNDGVIRRKAKDILRKQLALAKSLGADNVLFVPGTVGPQEGGEVRYDDAYDRTLEALAEAAPIAEGMGVRIGVENVWNKFLLSPLEARDLLDKVASPYVGFYLDVGNLIQFGFPQQWIRILGSRIVNVHVKDCRANLGYSGFVDLLAGDVDFREVMAALGEVGYDGYLNAEMGGYKDFKDQVIYNTKASMDAIFDYRTIDR